MTEKSRELREPPRLYGDGRTDDTEAVAWYLSRGLVVPDGDYVINADTLKTFLPAGFGGGFAGRITP